MSTKELSSTQKIIARQLPADILAALGINEDSLLNKGSKKQLSLFEAYLDIYSSLVQDFLSWSRFQYTGKIPKPPEKKVVVIKKEPVAAVL